MTTEAAPRSAPGRPGAERGAGAPPDGLVNGRLPALFGRLLILLVFTYLLSAFTDRALVNTLQVVLFLGVVLLVAAYRPAAPPHRADHRDSAGRRDSRRRGAGAG